MSSVGDATHRREFAEISDGLAAQLGIGSAATSTATLRLRIRRSGCGCTPSARAAPASPRTTRFSPWWRSAPPSAAPTTSGSTDEASGGDEDSGQFKLFADPVTGTLVSTSDGNFDTFVDDFQVSAYRVPVSSLEYTDENDVVTPTTFYCEPSSSRSYVEKVVRADSDAMVVLAPHGGNIETDTSAQAELFAEAYEDLAEVPVNIWNLEGRWGHRPDRRALAHHRHLARHRVLSGPHGAPDRQRRHLRARGVVPRLQRRLGAHVRGGRPRNHLLPDPDRGRRRAQPQRAVAQAIDAPWPGGIAFGIRDENEDEIDIPDACGREVTATGREGTHDDNIVNRLAVDHRGIQIEQSKTVRDEDPLRDTGRRSGCRSHGDLRRPAPTTAIPISRSLILCRAAASPSGSLARPGLPAAVSLGPMPVYDINMRLSAPATHDDA